MVASWFADLQEMEDITLNAAEAIGHNFPAQRLKSGNLTAICCGFPSKSNCVRIAGSVPRRKPGTRCVLTPARWVEKNSGRLAGWCIRITPSQAYIAQSGLYRVLVWPYLFKNYSVRDLAEFLEITGCHRASGRICPEPARMNRINSWRRWVSIGHNARGSSPIIPKSNLRMPLRGSPILHGDD